MKKTGLIHTGICLLSAACILAACGQKEAAGTSAAETSAVETEALTTIAETESEKEETKEKADEEETAADDKDEAASEETTKSEEDTSGAETKAETEPETSATETVQETSAEAAREAGKSVQDIYGEITQKVSLNSPMTLPDEFISNYYGIDVGTLDEYVFSMSEAAISAETVVILKAKDAGSTGALSTALQTVIDQKKSEMENYLPDQFQIVDKSSVQVSGNYVYLVISEQADAISQIIRADIQ